MALVMSHGKMSTLIYIGRERMMTWWALLCSESVMLNCGFALRNALDGRQLEHGVWEMGMETLQQ